MSFLADPPALFLDGEGYARLPEAAQGGAAKVMGGLSVAANLAVGMGLYLEHPWARPLWRSSGARSGPDYMVGWPLFHGKRRRRSARMDAAAALIFASYPLWWWLGWDHGRRRRPRAS
jgi:hypothetical protein